MLSRGLTRHGFEVEAVSDAANALALARETRFDAAVLDVVMPGQDGLSLGRSLREGALDLPIVLLTGYTHSPLLASAEREAMAVFQKPVAIQDVVDYLNQALR
jgi:DNA-binding response OmpR family regulator